MLKKPGWLRVPYFENESSGFTQSLLNELELNTVCDEANCPNRLECFSNKTATFMILGTSCTRNCGFCNVSHGIPQPVDENEPKRIAEAIRQLDLKYVVITSVTRDDLPDGGSGQFAKVIYTVKNTSPETAVEVLIPDLTQLKIITDQSPAVISHNIETVASLYKDVRPEADYFRSLGVLSEIKRLDPGIRTKSGIMLGLGETYEEVLKTFDDLLDVGCEFLTIGQYLNPSKEHYPVVEYIEPKVFTEYGRIAKEKGFCHVASAPFVRSSYNAAVALDM
jgi:lipoic acid synthetase